MITKLRRRFVLVATGAVFLVILLLMGVINAANFTAMDQQTDAVLALLAENEGTFPDSGKVQVDFSEVPEGPELDSVGTMGLSAETPYETRYFTVTIKGNGNLAEVDTGNIAAISTEKAVAIAKVLVNEDAREGYYGNYKYLARETDRGRLYIFLDCSQRLGALRSFLLNSLVVSVFGILAVFLLVLAMSKQAVAPMVESYEKQKEFITNAGHELKTPLAVIDSCATVLELENGENKWVTGIREQVIRMNSLTQSLISLARIEESGERLQKERFCISELFREVLESFEAVAESHNKTLSLDIQENLWYVGNAETLAQLCSILTDNALKYADGDSQISISLTQQGKKLLFISENQTQGLQPGVQKHLFDRFYRGEGGTPGHGIGLSMAQSIAAAHNGKIEAYSQDGSRLKITVTLL